MSSGLITNRGDEVHRKLTHSIEKCKFHSIILKKGRVEIFSFMRQNRTLNEVGARTGQAVTIYWATRTAQQQKQQQSGRADQGLRSAVTGGAQMDGFIQLFADLITDCGLPSKFIHRKKTIVLPGFFRPTKEWDLIVVKDGTLIAAIEAKSQVGPSFGNNFNNRTEEALGSALDLWTAYREGAFLSSP